MTSETGPPLHRKFDERKAMEHIKNRYQTCNERISAGQILLLQASDAFRGKCAHFYDRGYPDWVILMGAFNTLVNHSLQNSQVDLTDPTAARTAMEEISTSGVFESVEPEIFCSDLFDRSLHSFFMSAMQVWGFQPRGHGMNVMVVEEFLRLRMRFFDFDLPHERMFGMPPGDWPKLS